MHACMAGSGMHSCQSNMFARLYSYPFLARVDGEWILPRLELGLCGRIVLCIDKNGNPRGRESMSARRPHPL